LVSKSKLSRYFQNSSRNQISNFKDLNVIIFCCYCYFIVSQSRTILTLSTDLHEERLRDFHAGPFPFSKLTLELVPWKRLKRYDDLIKKLFAAYRTKSLHPEPRVGPSYHKCYAVAWQRNSS